MVGSMPALMGRKPSTTFATWTLLLPAAARPMVANEEETPMTQPDLAFRSFDPMTSPGAHADLFDVTPSDPAGVSAMVQGLLLHQHWAGAYGQTLTPARIEESHL